MRPCLKFFPILLLLASTVAANAGIFIVEVHVNRSNDCKSGYSFYFDGGATYCLSSKGNKIDLASFEGQTVKLGGQYKAIDGVSSFVVTKINPSGEPNTYKETGFTGFLAAANPYVQGAAAGLSGGSVAQPAPIVYPVSPQTPEPTAENVPGLPQCTRTQYTSADASLYIVNSCSVAVTVAFTSDSGKTWGQGDVGPNAQTEATAFGIGYDPKRDGTVYLFTCPKGTQPVMPNGNAFFPRDYKGQYTCHR